MEQLRKLELLDEHGRPVDERLQQGRSGALLPTVPETLSRAPGRRAGHRGRSRRRRGASPNASKRQAGPIEKLRGYAWKGSREHRRVAAATRRRCRVRVRPRASRAPGQTSCRSCERGTAPPSRFERGILLRQLEEHHHAGGGADLQPEGARLLERGHREAPGQLREFRRQGDEPLETKNSCADGGQGVENSRKVDNSRKVGVVSGIIRTSSITRTHTETAE